jgi:predicted GIY-YIG superfamily endonuclease
MAVSFDSLSLSELKNEIQRLVTLTEEQELTIISLQAEKDFAIRQCEKEKKEEGKRLTNEMNIIRERSLQERERKISKSDQKKSEDTTLSIYVLKCEKGKYYVGKTRGEVTSRFRQHLTQDRGSSWTLRFQPERILAIYPDSEDSDENKVTKEWMKLKGIENVRGGLYTSIEINEDVVEQLKSEFRSDYDECFVCGGTDHFAGSCNVSRPPTSPVIIQREDGNVVHVTCTRCGRDSHDFSHCYAKTDYRGRPLLKRLRNNGEIEERRERGAGGGSAGGRRRRNEGGGHDEDHNDNNNNNDDDDNDDDDDDIDHDDYEYDDNDNGSNDDDNGDDDEYF